MSLVQLSCSLCKQAMRSLKVNVKLSCLSHVLFVNQVSILTLYQGTTKNLGLKPMSYHWGFRLKVLRFVIMMYDFLLV